MSYDHTGKAFHGEVWLGGAADGLPTVSAGLVPNVSGAAN
jgi:hypothetical protein